MQHAAAFQYMVNAFVKEDKKMTEELIKFTHPILVKGLRAEEAGIVSGTDFAGTCGWWNLSKTENWPAESNNFPGCNLFSDVKRIITLLTIERRSLSRISFCGQISPRATRSKSTSGFFSALRSSTSLFRNKQLEVAH